MRLDGGAEACGRERGVERVGGSGGPTDTVGRMDDPGPADGDVRRGEMLAGPIGRIDGFGAMDGMPESGLVRMVGAGWFCPESAMPDRTRGGAEGAPTPTPAGG